MSVTLEDVRLARKRAYDRVRYELEKQNPGAYINVGGAGYELIPIKKNATQAELDYYYEYFTQLRREKVSEYVELKYEVKNIDKPRSVMNPYGRRYRLEEVDKYVKTGDKPQQYIFDPELRLEVFNIDIEREQQYQDDEDSERYPWSEPDEAWGYDEDDDDDEPLDSLWATPEDIEEEREKAGLEPYDYYDEPDEEEEPEPEEFDPYEGWEEDENYWWEDEGYEDDVAPNSFSSFDEMIGRAYDYGSMIGEAFEEAIGNIMNVTGLDEDSVVGLTNNMGDVWEELEKASAYLNVEGSASERAYVIGLNHLNTALSKLYSGFGLTYVRGL